MTEITWRCDAGHLVITRNLKSLDLQIHDRQPSRAMLTQLFSLRDCFRTRDFLQADILALRHQLFVLQHSSRGQAASASFLTESCRFDAGETMGVRHPLL